jgi:hypothetical protein
MMKKNWDAVVFWVAFVMWLILIGLIAGGLIE